MSRQELIDQMIETKSTTYVHKLIVRAEFKDITEDTPIEVLYKNYLLEVEKRDKAKELQGKTKSDLFYRGYIVDEESYALAAKIYATLIYKMLNLRDLPDVDQAFKTVEIYNKAKEKAKHKIECLQEFKPNEYKSKIELLNSLLEDNK